MKYKSILFLFLFISIINGQNRYYSIDDIYSNKLVISTNVSGFQWIPGAREFSFIKMNPTEKVPEIYSHNIMTGEAKVLVGAENLKLSGQEKPISLGTYKWSGDGSRLLLTGTLLARTLKTGGAFFVYDMKEGKIIYTGESEDEQENIEFSPDGKKVSFVRGNNLYVCNIADGKTTQLTNDGSDVIINGAFDWVYEEEFSIITAYQWSPDSKSIAFWRMDQSNVPKFAFQKYDSLYLNFHEMRYPKPGAKNSLVQIGVVDIESKNTVWMDIGKETDIYIPRIKFTKDPGKLAIQRLDRLQQHLELLIADTKTGSAKVILQEQTTGWIDINNSLTFLNDNSFIWESEKDNFSHYYLYAADGKLIKQITKGDFEDSELLGVDEKTSTLYYVSNERGVIYSDIYCIKTDGTGKRLLTPEKGTHIVSFSPDFAFFTDRYSNATTPSVLSLYSADGAKLRDLTKVTNNFSEKYDIGETSFLRFTTSGGVELQAMMIKPANFDPAKKYPVLFYNYSGPGSQTVKDLWDRQGLWHQLLAQKGYIIFQMDNRGTAGRGRDFKHLLYKKLGTLEVEDLIDGAKYLATLPYVDKSRIGIWGWSYGGYMSALTLMKGAEYFKMAVAVAPVTDWLFYDNIYTERFMSLPELNPEGYKNASVLESTDLLKGKLLIVHGTGDDNVHFQNSVKLVEKLIAGNKQFRTMYYPEKEHSIYGGKTRQHLFTMLTEFILSEL